MTSTSLWQFKACRSLWFVIVMTMWLSLK